jgi:uncharacterized protein with HEPN domain
MDRHRFEKDRLIRIAVERCLARLCEAAYRPGPNAEAPIPDQPWRQIRGLGTQFRHGYDRINLEIVWNTARNRLPAVPEAARKALACLQRDAEPTA